MERLEKIVNFAQSKSVSLTVARYLKDELHPPQASIRITVNLDLTKVEIDKVFDVLNESINCLSE